MFKLIPLFLLSSSILFAHEISIDVDDPIQREGEISTVKGGIIKTDKMRIQARNISLKNVNGEKIVTASEDLLIVYDNKFFVGDKFTYNFTTQTGQIDHGISHVAGVFAGGEKIIFEPDGDLKIEKVFLTESDNKDYQWAIHSDEATVDKTRQVGTSGMKFDLFKTPVFWFPSTSANVKPKHKKESTMRYHMMWEKKQGPLFLMRYRAYDADGLKVYVRGEYRVRPDYKHYRVSSGVGGAIEVDYASPTKSQTMSSRNFYAYDTFYNDLNPNKVKSRYRIQGVYAGESRDKHIESFCRWDVLSDKNMRQDFPTQLFELQTLERTEAYVKAKYDPAFTSVYARPRVNNFRGFMQELPTFKVALKPYELGPTGIVFENYFKMGFLDYAYANNLAPSFHAGRFETAQGIYRAFNLGPISVTPKVGFNGIYYTNNPKNEGVQQAIFSYDLDTHADLFRSFDALTHYMTPYVQFQGMESPLAKPSNVYIFSIQDGLNRIHQCRLGLKNSFYPTGSFATEPRFFIDASALSFYNTDTFKTVVPKGTVQAGWNFAKVALSSKLGWNFNQNTLDFSNVHLGCTFNEYFAFSLELRHRGKFDWRKNNHNNYLLDVTRSIDELEHSPLSDARTVFLARWELQIAPLWTIQIYNHLGWRPGQPFYHESKVDLFTLISNTWKLRLSYMRTVRTDQFSFGITMI